jgi:hypothetical protein
MSWSAISHLHKYTSLNDTVQNAPFKNCAILRSLRLGALHALINQDERLIAHDL